MKTFYGVFTKYGNLEDKMISVGRVSEIEGEEEGTTELISMCHPVQSLVDRATTLEEAKALADMVSLELAIPRAEDLDCLG